MLGRRYANDGASLLKLNPLQQAMKAQIDQKVSQGSYHFEAAPCCICRGDSFEMLAEKDRYGLYMPVVICVQCGLIQTNPRMDQKSYSEFYNLEYRKLYVGASSASQEFFDNQRRRGARILEYLTGHRIIPNPPNGLRILEVGCGAGGILHVFREHGAVVKGIDLGEEYLEFGRSNYDLDLSAATVHDLDSSFQPDLVIYSHVLEHILDPNRELAQIRALLAEAGQLYIEVPGVKNLLFSYEMDFLRMLQNAHVYHFTLRTLTNLMRQNGFSRRLGNEDVVSIFKKAAPGATPAGFVSDYPQAARYLRRVEALRQVAPLRLTRAKNIYRKIESRLIWRTNKIRP